jgi:spore germination protein GerM
MKKKLFFLVFLVFLFLFVLGGTVINGATTLEVEIYFFDQEDSLVSVPCLIEIRDSYNAEIIRKTINILLKGAKEPLFSFIPKGTRLNHVVLIGKSVILDFSKELQNYGGGSFNVLHIREQFEKTLYQFSFIENVIFFVNGEGEKSGVLQP